MEKDGSPAGVYGRMDGAMMMFAGSIKAELINLRAITDKLAS